MAQDCNQGIFGTGLSASIHPPRTGLSASETAINQLGRQSTVVGLHYLQLDALTVLGPSCFALQRMRIWRAALEGLLSRTPLDLVTRASHAARTHPIETRKLSRPPCLMRVYLTKTERHQA